LTDVISYNISKGSRLIFNTGKRFYEDHQLLANN
jgi:hypothetical protein